MRCLLAAFAILAWMSCTSPSYAIERLANPARHTTLVTRIADLDQPAAHRHRYHRHAGLHHHHRGHWHWKQRAYASRWLHFQYVNAGYPVRHYHRDIIYTYLPHHCCCCSHHRHW
jgi:hypothetical protein